MTDKPQAFKELIFEHKLKSFDIAECFELGDVKVTKSRIQSYRYSEDNRRFVSIQENEFEAFKTGLTEFLKNR